MELSFKKGDTIYVSGEMDEDGFYEGELNGKRGLVPSNYLRDAAANSLSNTNSLPRQKLDDRSSRGGGDPSLSQNRTTNPPPIIREPSHDQGVPRHSQYSSQQPQPRQQLQQTNSSGSSSLRPTGQTNVEMHGQSSGGHMSQPKR